MDTVPSIIMICWNRLDYLERSINHLLKDTSDFRLYMWDNASADGASDFIHDLKDDRIVMKHFHKENVRQYQPWFWFLDNCKGEIVGKLDDDILGPNAWMTRFSEIISEEERIGLLGGWVYQPDEWNETIAAHKIRQIGRHRIFQNSWVAGCIMLGRIGLLRQFSPQSSGFWGTPVDHMAITRAGYISGYPIPIPFAENLDDPRHPDCRMNRPGGWDEFAAFTARMRNFSGPDEYGQWIAEDATKVLRTPIADQLRSAFPNPLRRLRNKVENKLKRMIRV